MLDITIGATIIVGIINVIAPFLPPQYSATLLVISAGLIKLFSVNAQKQAIAQSKGQ